MSKPWDNEPSSEADKSWMYPPSFDADTKVVSHEKFADLERRLRHAEKLLEQIAGQLFYADAIMTIDVEDHLKAARQEDGR